MQDWLESFPRLPIDDAVARESERLRQQHGLKVPDAIILATAICSELPLPCCIPIPSERCMRRQRGSLCSNRAHNGDAPPPTDA